LRSHSRAFLWLLDKERRELVASRSWWVLLLALGPLVGISFISAVRTYAEVSGLGGTAGGVGEAMAPLIGVWAPTFSACELAAVFLLPFVAIRLVGGDRQSGALKLELQQGMPAAGLVAAKAIVLLIGWLIAMLPPFLAMALWKSYGGTLYPPELASVIAGHVINAGLTIALGAAMAAVAEHPSTAAILTLGVTVGTWILNFFAAIQGGWWERAAEYTPTAVVSEFQHGLVRLDVVLIAALLVVAGLGYSAIWMRLGVATRRRALESVGLAAAIAVAILACTFVRGSWDLSEARANSFPEGDERALSRIHGLRMEVHLAPEDPRRVELENRALAKLRRLMPDLRVDYKSATSIGIFEQANAGYGEIWYFLNGKKEMSRTTTAEGVLEAIYAVCGVSPPKDEDVEFRGHPLSAQPRGAALVFFGIWPGLVLLAAFVTRRGRL
jgi:ABC-2 type transport system permease protein